MRRLSLMAVLMLASSGGAPVAAAECTFPSAQSEQCACTLAVDPAQSSPVAKLSELIGDVKVTGRAGFTPIAQGQNSVDLYVGDSVVVPDNSQALLNFGPDCRRLLEPNTSLGIRQENDCACAAIVGAGSAASGGGGGAMVGGALLLGGAAAAAVLLSQDDDGNPVSP